MPQPLRRSPAAPRRTGCAAQSQPPSAVGLLPPQVSRGVLEGALPIDGRALLLFFGVQSHATSFSNAYFENFFLSDNSTFTDGVYNADGADHPEPAAVDDWGHGSPWSSGKASPYKTLDPVGSPLLDLPDDVGVPIGATNGDEMCHQIDLEDWTGNSWMALSCCCS